MPDTPTQNDWTKPAAVAVPKGGFFKDKVEQGQIRPGLPENPARYGFSIIAKIVPGTEEKFYEYGETSRQPWPAVRTSSRSSGCTTCAGTS